MELRLVNWRAACIQVSGLLVTLAAGGCSWGPVTTTKDDTYDLSRYRTYQWVTQDVSEALELKDPRVDYSLDTMQVRRKPDVDDRLRPMVEKDLQERGYRPSLASAPDFYVTYYAKDPDGDWLSSWQGSTGGFAGTPVVIFPNYDRGQARAYREGVVYLTFYDAKSKRPAWTARVDSTKFGNSFGEPEVATAVDQIVDEFKKNTG